MLGNRGKYYASDASFGIAQNLFTGSVIQSFLLASQVDEHHVALYVSAMSAISFCFMLMTSWVVDKIKNIIKFNAYASLLYLTFFGVLIFFSFYTKPDASVKYVCIFAAGAFINILGAFRQNISLKLPYNILKNIDDYGPMLGTSGVITGAIGIAFYGIMSLLMENLDFWTVMRVFMPLGAVAVIISFIASRSYKPAGNYVVANDTHKKKLNIFKFKTFYILAIPDFLHGFWNGIFGIALVIGSYYKIVMPEMAGMMMLLIQLFYTVSCIFYAKISKNPKASRFSFLFAGISLAVLAPMLLVGKNSVVFLSVYAIVCLLFYFIGKHFQVVLTKIVDYEILGQYSAFYGAVRTFGTIASSYIAIPMLKMFGGYITLGIASASILISCIVYYIYTAKKNVF